MLAKAMKWTLLNAGLGTGYLLLSLAVGEVHPFTLVPMYNQFPNWSYAFFITDEKEQVIPIKAHFRYGAGNLGHHFCAVAADENIHYGNRVESGEELEKIGGSMLEKLSGQCYKKPESAEVQLHRLCFYWEQDSIRTEDKMLSAIATSTLQCPK